LLEIYVIECKAIQHCTKAVCNGHAYCGLGFFV